MRNVIIQMLGGATPDEHAAIIAAHGNATMLKNQYQERALKYERTLEEMENKYIQAAMQAEQLLERLRRAEEQLENKEQERANASAGWNKTLEEQVATKRQLSIANEVSEKRRISLIEAERHIAELNTLIAKESDGSDIEFFIQGGNPAEGRAGSRTPLRLFMTGVQDGVERHVELRSLSYSKANREILEEIMKLANKVVRG
jgi:chromosome segregation ATPase